MIESINLNLIPSGVSPVCHVSQYDAGRQIKINLFEGINPYTIQSGDAFTLNVRKPDNTIVTTSVSGTQGDNYITISTTEQIAAVVGENLCELKITNGSTVIGTLNFIMQVERDVLADGIPSQSVIEDLDERIAEAIGDNYYNKTETDALLALKADKSELYNVYPTDQESGSIAHITDGADNIPVKSLVSQIVAVESGSGEKSPDNPYTISGFDNGIITRCGKNLYNKATITRGKYITNTGAQHSTATGSYSDYIPIKKNTPYYFSHIIGLGSFYSVAVYDENKTFIETVNIQGSYDSSGTITFTRGAYIRVNVNMACVDTCQIEFGTSATDYTPFVASNDYTFTFGQTVFGGYFDNKGNLVVTHGIVDLGDLSWTYHAPSGDVSAYFDTYLPSDSITGNRDVAFDGMSEIYNIIPSRSIGLSGSNIDVCALAHGTRRFITCDPRYTDATSYTNAMNGVMLVYPLATPITLAISSQDIPTALGENNFYSDTGDVDVTIRADIGLYIDKRLNVSRSTPNNLVRAAAYVDDPESVNEAQEDNEER